MLKCIYSKIDKKQLNFEITGKCTTTKTNKKNPIFKLEVIFSDSQIIWDLTFEKVIGGVPPFDSPPKNGAWFPNPTDTHHPSIVEVTCRQRSTASKDTSCILAEIWPKRPPGSLVQGGCWFVGCWFVVCCLLVGGCCLLFLVSCLLVAGSCLLFVGCCLFATD